MAGLPLALCAAAVRVEKTVSPGRKAVVGAKVSLPPLTVAVPAFFPPACWLNTCSACRVAWLVLKAWSKPTITAVLRGAASALAAGNKLVTTGP